MRTEPVEERTEQEVDVIIVSSDEEQMVQNNRRSTKLGRMMRRKKKLSKLLERKKKIKEELKSLKEKMPFVCIKQNLLSVKFIFYFQCISSEL